MSQSGTEAAKGIDQRAREAAREAARSEGLTLGEYLDRLMKTPAEGRQPNEVAAPAGMRRPRPNATDEALERLTRRIEATEARSAMAITGMDDAIHDLVGRLEDTQQTTAAIAGHVEGVIDQLRETHDALKQKVRRLEEEDSQKENLEALKALESALGKLASHVYEENELAGQETQAIKGRVESGFMDIIERVEAMETRVETNRTETAEQVKQGIEQAALRAAGVARQVSERVEGLETEVQERLAALSEREERLEATETRVEAIETDVSSALDSLDMRFDQIQNRLTLAETTTDSALKNLETSVSSLDERIGDVASKMDPDLAGRLRSEFEARFEDMMTSVRETVDSVRQELAEEIARAAAGADEDAVNEMKETLGSVQERLEASEERQASAIEKVSEQVGALNDTFDSRLREVEERSDAATSEAVREEIERLGKTVSDRIDELAEDLTQRVNDSEARSAEAIEQIGDQVAAANNRLQLRQNEAIKTLAEQVDENRKKADARLSDALSGVTERLEQMQSQANESLSPVQKAIAMLAARLEGLEENTPPPGAPVELDSVPASLAGIDDDPFSDNQFEAFDSPTDFGSIDDFDTFEAFADLDLEDEAVADVEPAVALPDAEQAPPSDDAQETEINEPSLEPSEDDSGVAFETEEDYTEDLTVEEDDTEVFEAGIESWASDQEDDHQTDAAESFEDDFDAIRAAVEGLSFATLEAEAEAQEADDESDGDAAELLAEEIEEDFNDPLEALDGLEDLDEAHTEARESDIFDDEEFEEIELPTAPAADAEIASEPEAEPEAVEEADKQLDEDTADYLTRARKAAMAASFGKGVVQKASVSGRPVVRMSAGGGSSRLPLIAAASAVAVAGVAAGGYLYIRGKQEAPVQATPASTYVDPSSEDTAAASLAVEEEMAASDDLSAAAIEEDLFEAPATPPAPAQYAPVPPVVTVQAAAASGNYIAQYQMAQEELTSGDYADGAALMRKAAQKGLPIAQYALAKLHERGTGVPKDLALAREWTEKAAIGGNVKAMHDLAVFMAEGEGGEQTYAGAVEWFRKGAEYGVVDSQYNLGVLYEQGLGISPNLTESLFWFDVANRNGDGGAPAKIAELIERVSPEAAAQARSRAATWQPATANAIANGRFGAQPWNMGNPLQVQAIQKALNALGYAAGTPDGIMGDGTATAIREYQRANNLPVTGTVTSGLIDALNAGARAG
ncbi:peptidoglycan-binding protein [uncultured Hyphomonas sp.]|uniref:peptidoglycan-binding protein n=1 Tax=uncultured Hyphomonas sp. TaxID=225298 RepID=UPI002AAAC7D5|nr:peptidoglycan-binding protein [uncultured Hyphomonas sp.]